MTTSSSSFVQDAASVAASRFHEAVSRMQKPETRSKIQAKVDYVVKTMFAPCVGQVGGVPFDDCGGGEGNGMVRSDAVPMEVSPNTTEEDMNTPAAVAAATQPQQFTFKSFPETKNNTKRQENSLQKLKKLGARHQLASGYIDETLPDAARPVSPEEKIVPPPSTDNADEHVADEVDFDDGISAISSHTLEEMEKRRLLHTVTVSPNQFSEPKLPPSSKIIENNDFSKKPMMETTTDGEAEEDDFFGEPFFNQTAPQLKTNVSNDSQQLEKAWDLDEVNYWKDEVKKDKKKNDKRSSRRQKRMSVEERAKRLRELNNRDLSRSRSRSSGSHPHDTSGLIEQIRGQV
mmetsp:Transcript_21398/g.30634  ORF Transcript_21398/g.30634 Transcript_21398/m.30634 type:complete len:346 (+) Transcript_21398:133-1170(+)|eukprot:CAMPEP_0201698036 /NCGR_PEP_ID=MMETSP0578-20130828/16531_1 /ASSEMBLY_ACC=CAM_ASM_000663 /TAXON_ID=267565 /ORGANISM="Skeletonema grethea, Strain CCMP 1804" /LENGTH=345 /DNA_ID=CAMNT_0048184443 /DNA_START=26 /DNA_END=1063 /DNA_ORIENTATION=-